MTKEEFTARYLAGLNPQQMEAVQATQGPVLLLAVPGSGKTTVLVRRLGYLLLCCDAAPEQILTMTYTVAATREMKQRFCSLFGAQLGARMAFRTINGLSAKIIEYYSRHCSSKSPFSLLDSEGELANLVAQAYSTVTGDFITESTNKDIRTAITYVKNMQLTEAEISQLDLGIKQFSAIYRQYQWELQQRRCMDYDDQMRYALRILQTRPEVLDAFSFPYLCVDESQDTSKIQHAIVRLLAKKWGNLFLVGDEDQSVYGFRAAYPEALLNFQRDYPGAKLLLIEDNYRSGREIVDCANAFVQKNQFRHPKVLRPTRPSTAPVQVVELSSRKYQYDYLLTLAADCREETAILYRNNDSVMPLIDRLERQKIPYACRPFDCAFFSHRIVQDVADIIFFAEHPEDCQVFLRIYYKMGLFLSKDMAEYACRMSGGKSLLEALLGYPELSRSMIEGISDLRRALELLPQRNGAEAMSLIWGAIGYARYVTQNQLDANKIKILLLLGEYTPSPRDLLNRLEELKDITEHHVSPPDCPLILSTIHSSKGLEYQRVYLLDVVDGILPADTEDAGRYQEERRLFYVAMTRAKDTLRLFRCKGSPAQFLEEIAGKPESNHLLGKSYCHGRWGNGRILGQLDRQLLVSFDDGGCRFVDLQAFAPGTEGRPDEKRLSAPEVACLAKTLKIGDTLHHKIFKSATITALSGDSVRLQFSDGSTKSFALHHCLEQGILQKN